MLFDYLFRILKQKILSRSTLAVIKPFCSGIVPRIKPLKNSIVLLFSLIFLTAFIIPLEAQWKQLNVGQPGEVHTVDTIGNNVFAGTSAGIYRSTDQGATWINVSSYYARCFAAKGSEIFAGTYLNGVVRSTDGGTTWGMTDTSMTREIDAIVVNGNYIFAGGGAVMLRSSDDGSSWTVIENGLSYGQTTVTGFAVTEGKILASTFAGVVVSTDDGNDWSTLVTTGQADAVTNCVAVIDSTVLVGWPGGIIRSTDDGRTWPYPNGWVGTSTTFSIVGDSSRIYAGTISGVHVSTDDGVTWTPINNGLPGSQVWSITGNDTNLFAATSSGVYQSTNKGINWALSSEGISGWDGDYITGIGNDIFAVMTSPSGGSILLYNSTDNGNTWTEDTSLHSSSIQAITVTNPYVYAITNSGIFASNNNGYSWTAINGGVMDTVYPARLVKSGSNLIVSTQGTFQGSGKVFLSSDNGTNWKNVGTNLPQIGPLATVGQNVYAGNWGDWTHSNDGLYRSTDNGENWIQINDTLDNISSLTASGTYIIAGRYVPPIPITDTVLPPPGGIFLSTDNGQTWSAFGSGLPKYPQVHSLSTQGNNIFVGLSVAYGNYSAQIYSAKIDGKSWTTIGDGLPFSPIQSIYVNDSSIFIGTIDDGIWRMPLSGITDVEQPDNTILPNTFRLEQNYPNPFNPATEIEYTLPIESKVKLEIFDVLGRKITTLVNKFQKAGNYTVTFNAGSLASGIYFYRINAGNFVDTKKLVLIK